MYRYRLIDAESGDAIGPLVSARVEFRAGESLARRDDERFELVKIVPAENENFRAYLVVRDVSQRLGSTQP
jgi:hypothetical protein